jgi:hypothetical protein
MRVLFIVVRILGAAAIIAAIVTPLVNNYNYWAQVAIRDTSSLPVNFFSYFTIDSNVIAVFIFVAGAALLLRKTDDPHWFGIVRACGTSYMTVTFIVYNTLLRGINVSDGLVVPWTNEVLHVVGPLVLILDWLFAPGRIRLDWKHIWVVIAFPLVWAVYTMIRGPLAYNELAGKQTWYPYPFLDPANSAEGYVSVAFYIVLIAVIIGLVGAAVIWVSRRSARWPLRATAEPGLGTLDT